jgi:hypothetical protein
MQGGNKEYKCRVLFTIHKKTKTKTDACKNILLKSSCFKK